VIHALKRHTHRHLPPHLPCVTSQPRWRASGEMGEGKKRESYTVNNNNCCDRRTSDRPPICIDSHLLQFLRVEAVSWPCTLLGPLHPTDAACLLEVPLQAARRQHHSTPLHHYSSQAAQGAAASAGPPRSPHMGGYEPMALEGGCGRKLELMEAGLTA
jgi:hypothetical protein